MGYITSKNKNRHVLRSFTRPIRCKTCDRDCFYYANNLGSKVLFEELGPPWEKHDCIKRQLKRPKPPWRWEKDGYQPCLIYHAHRVIQRQLLVVYVRALVAERNLALRVAAKDINLLMGRLHQPFVLKAEKDELWELNTYAQFDERFEPRAYLCSEANFAFPSPAEPTKPWFEVT